MKQASFPNLTNKKPGNPTQKSDIAIAAAFLSILFMAGGRLMKLGSMQSGEPSSSVHATERSSSSALAITNDDSRTEGSLTISYKKVKEGTTDYNKDFVVYAAEDALTHQPISVKQRAKLMMAASPKADEFAEDITKLIGHLPYRGVYFETKGVTSAKADQKQFEFCVVDGPSLADFAESKANPKAFQEHLQACSNDNFGCQSKNLSGDATLVAPKQLNINDDKKMYSHLAAFLRRAPEQRVTGVWKVVASTYYNILQTRHLDEPVWLSTAGKGIPWLHFRFDERPKYYTYSPFAKEK